MDTPPPQIPENGGNTKVSDESESPHQEYEGILKEGPSSATVASRKGRKRKAKPKDECSSESEVTVPRHNRGHTRGSRNNTDTKKLDSGKFVRYLTHIWDAFPEEEVKSFAYFEPWWFYMYADQNRNADVVKWIKERDIFSKRYVFVPIVMWSHWNLLVFCHLGQCLDSKSDPPCMLLLDSLHKAGPKRLESYIRRLVIDIFKSEARPENKRQLSKIPLLIPKVPQQKNGDECGYYVLYYIQLFMQRSPERFSVSEGYPYFMKKDWFTGEDVESFRKDLDAFPVDHDTADSMDSGDSVELIEAPSPDDES